MPKVQHPLFFITIVPPSPLREMLMEYKTYFRDTYQSKASLNSPPHITLHMPFKYPEKKLLTKISSLEQLAAGMDSFDISLKGFSAFTPRVIYADVVSNDTLNSLQQDVVDWCKSHLKIDNANYRNQSFHPHITLAFRDLKKPAFFEAWKKFENKPLEETFTVESFWLLKHDGNVWKEFKELKFKEK